MIDILPKYDESPDSIITNLPLDQVYSALDKKVNNSDAAFFWLNAYLTDIDSNWDGIKDMETKFSWNPEASISVTGTTDEIITVAKWDLPKLNWDIDTLYPWNYWLNLSAKINDVARPYKTRWYFELWEADSNWNDVNKIATSYNKTRLDSEKQVQSTNILLLDPYIVQEWNFVYIKVLVEFDGSDVSNPNDTTLTVYYQGDSISFLTLPISREILETVFLTESPQDWQSYVRRDWQWETLDGWTGTFQDNDTKYLHVDRGLIVARAGLSESSTETTELYFSNTLE